MLLLRDVLDFSAREVADVLDLSLGAVNSLLHRARVNLAEHDHREDLVAPDDDSVRTLLDDYVRAWQTSDLTALLQLITEDATFIMPPIPEWYRGTEAIRQFVAETLFGHGQPTVMLLVRANGENGGAIIPHRRGRIAGWGGAKRDRL